MDHDKKLGFVQNLTHMALTHAASTPNVPTPKGGMSHEKMLAFVMAMTKHGLSHFDAGGTALAGPTTNVAQGQTSPGGFNGAIGNFLGTNNKFQAQGTPIQAGTNVNQLDNAYTGAQGALGTQAGITGTLNNGLNQGATTQNTLSGLYLDQAQGRGPNPAAAALARETGNNVATQAALMAGQRGAGANAGLIARGAAQEGATTEQNAVGQAATMQAQQQLAAEGNLQNLAGNQIAQGTAATQGLNSTQQNEQNILQGANTSFNNENVSQQSNINSVNGQISAGNQKGAGNLLSGIGNALSEVPIIGSLFAEGGEVKKDREMVEEAPWVRAPRMLAEGGTITGMATQGPQSYAGQWLNSTVNTQGPGVAPVATIDTNLDNPFQRKEKTTKAAPESQLQGFDPNAAGSVGELGETDIPETLSGDLAGMDVSTVAYKGGLMKKGGNVNAPMASEKATRSGDSLENDKVPAMLSEGEIVIPRHITMGPNAPAKAAMFVAKELAKRGKK